MNDIELLTCEDCWVLVLDYYCNACGCPQATAAVGCEVDAGEGRGGVAGVAGGAGMGGADVRCVDCS